MSYVPLGDLCGLKNGTPFSNTPTPVKTVLLSNFGGASYASAQDYLNPNKGYQCNGTTLFKNAYPQAPINPYASAICSGITQRTAI